MIPQKLIPLASISFNWSRRLGILSGDRIIFPCACNLVTRFSFEEINSMMTDVVRNALKRAVIHIEVDTHAL